MTDARLDTGFQRHPKTRRLVKRLGLPGAWSLLGLWLWATENRSTGDLAGLSAEDLELAADWQGENGLLVSVLEDVGFLDGDAGSWRLHDWERRNPWVAGAESRSEKARWNALVKHHGRVVAEQKMPEFAARIAARRLAGSSEKPASSNAGDAIAETQHEKAAPSPSPSPKSKDIAPSGRYGAGEAERGETFEGGFEPDPGAGAGFRPERFATLAGRACLRMRELGCSATNPSHPDLIAALEEGVTIDALGHAAAEAVDAGKKKPFAYAIATARSRHAEGASKIHNGGSDGERNNGTSSGAGGARGSAIDRVLGNIARGSGSG